MKYIHSWSGGKDSTASIILDHIHGLPPSSIIFSEVMFDKKRGISGEIPEHIDFIKNKAIPVFEEWGYTVKVLRAEKDYLDCFHHVITKSKNPLRNGKKSGFPIGSMCVINDRIKVKAIRDYLKSVNDNFIQYIGIAVDEPVRLARLDDTKEISLLARYGYTEKMAYDLCREYNLLSPIYENHKRGGCWFCPNARYTEFVRLKQHHPELWNELKQLSQDQKLASQNFKYDCTFDEVNEKVDAIIDHKQYEAQQITLCED